MFLPAKFLFNDYGYIISGTSIPKSHMAFFKVLATTVDKLILKSRVEAFSSFNIE